jgi:uncharacterized protein (TIGR01777 family)
MRVVVSGSTGLIGTAVTASLERDGVRITRLVRRPPRGADEVRWDPGAPGARPGPAVLSGADAVIHLAGAPVASRPWTEARKRILRSTRIDTTRALATAMAAAADPPRVFLVASAVGWYGDTGGGEVDESAPPGTGFLAGLVRDWEAAAEPARAAGIRVVNLRSGVVLSGHGGMLGPLLLPFRLGLGARAGSGRQYFSWIALTDEVRAIRFLLDAPGLDGPVNLTAPEPVTNAEFTAALARAVGRPAVLRIPGRLLRVTLGELSSELLAGARVLPARLLAAGFEYRYPEIGAALAAELRRAH